MKTPTPEELRELSLRNQGAEIRFGRILETLPKPQAETRREPGAIEVLALLDRSLAKTTKQRRSQARQTSLKL